MAREIGVMSACCPPVRSTLAAVGHLDRQGISTMSVGETRYLSPTALMVDDTHKAWIRPDARSYRHQVFSRRVAITRTSETDFDAVIPWGVRHRWQPEAIPTQALNVAQITHYPLPWSRNFYS